MMHWFVGCRDTRAPVSGTETRNSSAKIRKPPEFKNQIPGQLAQFGARKQTVREPSRDKSGAAGRTRA